jgi:hypothetical protein
MALILSYKLTRGSAPDTPRGPAADQRRRNADLKESAFISVNQRLIRNLTTLSIGEETDILQSVEQLAQIYLTAQTGGALAAVSSLNQLPHEKEPEIYGITNNGTFEVRPVFDPSGQALRFTFDHVTANAIREPDATVNPRFPHVERHTVNAEVQISNLEIREISRFSSNSQLGLPSRYWGGIPVLKDIPYARPYVPLLGWFVRHRGRSATTTQSFIFGQSITYPTIADLMDLLSTDAPLRPEESEAVKTASSN